MNNLTQRFALAATLGLAVLASNSCETGGGGGSGSAYYDAGGFNDPWYYGTYYDDADLIAVPPGTRPERPEAPGHPIARPPVGPAAPTHPIARPPLGPRPMPVMPRGGGGRRR